MRLNKNEGEKSQKKMFKGDVTIYAQWTAKNIRDYYEYFHTNKFENR